MFNLRVQMSYRPDEDAKKMSIEGVVSVSWVDQYPMDSLQIRGGWGSTKSVEGRLLDGSPSHLVRYRYSLRIEVTSR